jgi:hypothetical protein
MTWRRLTRREFVRGIDPGNQRSRQKLQGNSATLCSQQTFVRCVHTR